VTSRASGGPGAPYVIVGAGMAADAACRGVRSVDEDTPILVLGREPHPPYDRPPLSKDLWDGKDEASILRDTESLGVEVRTGVRVAAVDRGKATVVDERGRAHPFSRLLLATGARPRRLPHTDQGVVYLRTLDDFRTLRGQVREGAPVAVVGGGLIGCEMAATLARGGCDVDQFFPERAPLAAVLPPPFARLLREYLEELGVGVHSGVSVRDVRRRRNGTLRVLGSGSRRGEDGYAAAVVGVGVEPRDELAREAGLDTAGGIVVDRGLRTSDSRIFAAGDVALVSLSLTGRRHRIEHEEHANESGFLAGRAMGGEEAAYDPIPYMYSRIGGILVELVGMPGPDDEATVRPPEEPSGRGFAAFRGTAGITGALVWNRPGRARVLGRAIRRGPAATFEELLEAARLEG
jgi:3-phenylpropionate/trans-cinnamate dioxygenase ferredoxin reductase component